MFKTREQLPVEEAKQTIIDLFARERGLTEKRRLKLQAVEVAQAGASESVAAGEDVEVAAAAMQKAQNEARTVEHAIEIVRQQRLESIRARFKVEAHEMRAVAEKKRAEAADIGRRTEPLLRKLSDLEGVQYTRGILCAQREGDWAPNPYLIDQKSLDECSPLDAQGGVTVGTAWYAVPRSVALATEARALDKAAAELDGRDVHRSGSIVKQTLQEVLDADEINDPQTLGPARHEIEAWAARIHDAHPELLTANRLYRLTWRNGAIVQEQSTISFRSLSGRFEETAFTAA